MPDPSAPITWGIIGSLGTLTTVLGGIVAKGWPIYRKAETFFSDWSGEEARPGREKRPGVMERLATLEAGQQSLAAGGEQTAAVVQALSDRLDRYHPPDNHNA